MSYKIYKSGSYVVISDTVNGTTKELNSTNVQITKTKTDVTLYSVLYNDVAVLSNVGLASILDINGAAYTETPWDAFRYEQCGATNSSDVVATAAGVAYDNTASGLAAIDVQAALDEIDAKVDGGVDTVTTGITAFATGGQASAVALTTEINNVTVCATAGDSVKLPTAVAGTTRTVKNSGAAALDIFPATSDSINALAVNLAIRIQPGSTVTFFAKDATVWESNTDESLTINAPSTLKGQLELKAADSAGNTVTTITNASQAAARTYTVPDAGASASFVMTEGAATINGVKTLGSQLISAAGAVGTPAIAIGASNTGLYEVSGVQTGFAQDGVLVATFDSLGMKIDSVRGGVQLGTTPVGTVSIAEYGDGRDFTTVLTLTNFVVGGLAGAAAALGVGNIVYAFPAGQHLELVSSLSSVVLTAAGTAVVTDTGLGSVIASGAVSVLSGTATFEDRLTGQAVTTDPVGGASASALTAATAGIGTGISLNVAGSVKNVFLNSAGTWNVDNTGNLTATGTIVLKWTKMG